MFDLEDQIYAGGFSPIVKIYETNQLPFKNVHLVLPPPDVDLARLRNTIVRLPIPVDIEELCDDARSKHYQLQQEFTGENELFLLHAMLISILRRRDPPVAASDLFFRIWRENGDEMARTLPVRWLISSATTFADCGQTSAQRAGGMGLYMLFDLIKLHDSERRLSGWKNDKGFRRKKDRIKHPLAFDMQPYFLARGDLDRTMLARLWKISESDATLRPLGIGMLRMVISDQRSVFSRVQKYRRKPANAVKSGKFGIFGTGSTR